MTMRIVDRFESINVEHHQRQRAAVASRSPHLAVEALERVSAVEAAGQGIGEAVDLHLFEQMDILHGDAENRGEGRDSTLLDGGERRIVLPGKEAERLTCA